MEAAIIKAALPRPAVAAADCSRRIRPVQSTLEASCRPSLPAAHSQQRKTCLPTQEACTESLQGLPWRDARTREQFHGKQVPVPCHRGPCGPPGLVAGARSRTRMCFAISGTGVTLTNPASGAPDGPLVQYSPLDVKAAQCYLAALNPDTEVTCTGPHITLDLASVFSGTNRSLPSELAGKSLVFPFHSVAMQLDPPRVIADALRILAIRGARELRAGAYLRGASLRREYGDTRALTQENMVWFLTHCQAVRDVRLPDQGFVVDGVPENYSGLAILTNDYADQSLYFNAASESVPYEACWWALQGNAGLTMRWPSAQFIGEDIIVEWACFEDTLVDVFGRVSFSRLGHRGGIYRKLTESTTVRRNVLVPQKLPS